MVNKRWDKENTYRVAVNFNLKKEQDILNFFEEHEEKTPYIKRLILEDINNENDSTGKKQKRL